MFQLVLSDRLRVHLAQVAAGAAAGASAVVSAAAAGEQPVVYDASTLRMAQMPGYTQSARADNVRLFHGREVRKVPTAAGGFGFVLQLVFAGEEDVEGWTPEEVAGYDGWGHDASRTWRDGTRLEAEGYPNFKSTFGEAAFTLSHRFYLHLDQKNQMWLSAEDGCEGHPAPAPL